LLEAMAAGCAIVATPIAAAGLSQEAQSAMYIVDNEREFAEAINVLLSHPEKRRELGIRAQEMVKKHYDWSVIIPKLLRIYSEVKLG